ncbi:MAG: hypothetical protein U5L95_03710 [Candidatus Saccharibacteria bacterium]|nr:hypothetical protein [Candidatus Saccharibacteria bacterium]
MSEFSYRGLEDLDLWDEEDHFLSDLSDARMLEEARSLGLGYLSDEHDELLAEEAETDKLFEETLAKMNQAADPMSFDVSVLPGLLDNWMGGRMDPEVAEQLATAAREAWRETFQEVGESPDKLDAFNDQQVVEMMTSWLKWQKGEHDGA